MRNWNSSKLIFTVLHIFRQVLFGAGNQAKKIFFFKKKKSKDFQLPPILNIFSRKFQGLAFLITTITLLHAITYYINYKVLVN